jgi:hypothetical protein
VIAIFIISWIATLLNGAKLVTFAKRTFLYLIQPPQGKGDL